jgi:hypothetical protein
MEPLNARIEEIAPSDRVDPSVRRRARQKRALTLFLVVLLGVLSAVLSSVCSAGECGTLARVANNALTVFPVQSNESSPLNRTLV